MKTLILYIYIFFTLFYVSNTQAQFVYQAERPSAARGVTIITDGEAVPEVECTSEAYPDKGNDPGYEAYRKGYDLILDEEWEEAVKQMKSMVSGYPKSQYVDDATYWIAYAYKNIDEDKAVELYKKFIKTYPKSNYYDDAVADLSELDGNFTFTVSGDSQHVSITRAPGGFAIATGTTMRLAQQQLRVAQRMMAPQATTIAGTPLPHMAMGYYNMSHEKLDEETQLQLEVLNALGDKRDDENSYSALKEVAIDSKQHRTLRVAAMDQLAEFKKPDPLPVFIEIAKKDTSEEIQNMAIDYIGSLSGNKNRSVETLSELFSAIPKYRISQLQAVLGSIAEIGNDKSVDFLGTVARSNDNYDLRRDAVYYLGGIGNEKARAVLLEILKTKKQK